MANKFWCPYCQASNTVHVIKTIGIKDKGYKSDNIVKWATFERERVCSVCNLHIFTSEIDSFNLAEEFTPTYIYQSKIRRLMKQIEILENLLTTQQQVIAETKKFSE
ncbi:TPA: hypothetical protein ACX6SJ_003874 [Photobacterium damselae]